MVESIDRTGPASGAPAFSGWSASSLWGDTTLPAGLSPPSPLGGGCLWRSPSGWLRADLVDVHQATVQRVRIWAEGPMLQIAGRSLLRQVPFKQIDWHLDLGPARQRMARLPDGSALCAVLPQEWDDWCQRVVPAAQRREQPLSWRQLWPLATIALGLLCLGLWITHQPVAG